MRINGIVVLGVSAPEDSKKYGKTVCIAAWQKDHGMMRIYPATPLDGFGRWKVFDLDLERPEPKHDTRKESWKRIGPGKAEPSRKVTDIVEKREILESSLRDCYLKLNETRESLCVVRPSEVTRLGFREHPEQLPKTADMIGHHDDWCSSRDTYSHSPFIHYRCSSKC